MNLRDDEEDSIDKKYQKELIKWLNSKLTNFQNYYQNFEAKLVEKNNSRKMLLFTIKEELLHKDQRPTELAQALLSQAINTLNYRKGQLTSYTISVVENNELISRDMVNYYDNGKITRYLMLSPVQSFVNYGQSGSDTPKLSLLLAMEVEFTKKGVIPHDFSKTPNNSSPTPSPVIQGDKNIMMVPDEKISLLIPNDRCSSFDQSEQLLRKGFVLPGIDQLAKHRKNLTASDKIMDVLNRASTDLIWTKEKTLLGRKVYSLNDGRAISINEETGCALFIGIGRYIEKSVQDNNQFVPNDNSQISKQKSSVPENKNIQKSGCGK
jgi:hypothetical protein